MRNTRTLSTSVVVAACCLMALNSCGITRTTEYKLTNTTIDTLVVEESNNAPGENRGVVFPSSTSETRTRIVQQYDSLFVREYPDFIRYGLVEYAGFAATGGGDNPLAPGLFGVYEMFGFDLPGQDEESAVFTGGLTRYGILEYRLRWFQDAANWSIGTYLYEEICKDAATENTLGAVLPIYIKKRYFLRDDIPYITVSPYFGFGMYPSVYGNLGVSLDVGSLSGLNFRAYAGYAMGTNPVYSPFVRDNRNAEWEIESTQPSIPYIGLGVSFLDFHNHPRETEEQWHEHVHSGWQIGFLNVALVNAGVEKGLFELTDGESAPVSGLIAHMLPVKVALPYLNKRLYAGTSLFSLHALGLQEWGMSVLPVRLGYWHTLLPDELTVEPFIEYGYYPSSMFTVGSRVNLFLTRMFNVGLIGGFTTGSSPLDFDDRLIDELGLPDSFSTGFFGLHIGVSDRIFFQVDGMEQ